jgi:hypothetical protein
VGTLQVDVRGFDLKFVKSLGGDVETAYDQMDEDDKEAVDAYLDKEFAKRSGKATTEN